MKKARGAVLWRGLSALDSMPIVVLGIRSRTEQHNKKTGGMIQSYILRSSVSPIEASITGKDSSICGTCPHRKVENGTCYVRLDTGPTQVYKAFLRGSYSEGIPGYSGEKVRIGTYGDPVAVPLTVWETILQGTVGHTGYTHQWKEERAQPYKSILMASCDNLEEDRQARELGWRTFTIVPSDASIPETVKSFLCPASERAGKKLQCAECLACDGNATSRHASVYIPVHGLAFKVKRFDNLITIGGRV